MFTTKRFAVLLIAAMALPVLVFGEAMAAGGFFPTIPSFFVLHQSQDVTATIVLDPNGPLTPVPPATSVAPATPTGTFGSIAITRQNVGTATATFQVERDSSLGELRFGCNLFDTNSRFVIASDVQPTGLPLGSPGSENWLTSAVTTTLFSQLGVALVDSSNTVRMIPGITGVISQKCVPFPKKNDTLDFLMLSEILKSQHIKPLPLQYPDRPTGASDPTQQWFPGFLVLEVTIGFWADPSTITP
jgi:hypothetical protein